MVDHLARARELRDRAAKCEEAAKGTGSAKFADCYRLLARNFRVLAQLEEEYVERETAALRERNRFFLENGLMAAE